MRLKTLNEMKEAYAESRGFSSWISFTGEYEPKESTYDSIAKAFAEQFINRAVEETQFEIRCENTSIHRLERSIQGLLKEVK